MEFATSTKSLLRSPTIPPGKDDPLHGTQSVYPRVEYRRLRLGAMGWVVRETRWTTRLLDIRMLSKTLLLYSLDGPRDGLH